MTEVIPIIDVFAGPGGLGEGFSAFRGKQGKPFFKIGLSVEKDPFAHSTLQLRSFFRQFSYSEIPEDYYSLLRGDINRDELFGRYPEQSTSAKNEAWCAELGSGQDFDDELDYKIKRVIGDSNRWVLIGGPPCQAYSIIGRARENKENDARNYLYIEYLRIIAKHRPAIFVMENVKGILSSNVQGQQVFNQILSDLKEPVYGDFKGCKYRVFSLVKKSDEINSGISSLRPEDFIVECEKYGIPQARHRVILLGVREDLSHCQPKLLKQQLMVPLDSVIRRLPRLRSGFSKETDCPALWKQRLRQSVSEEWIKSVRNEIDPQLAEELTHMLSRIRCPLDNRGGEFLECLAPVSDDLKWWYEDKRLGGVCNHASRGHMRKDIYRYVYASCFASFFGVSPKLHEFPSELQPEHKNAKSGHFNDRFRVQAYGRPSTTITCHISKDGHYYIHPDPTQCRSLTVREAARLQTFPDNYLFCGNRTQQYVQVGNAVPPLLATQIARIVMDLLERSRNG